MPHPTAELKQEAVRQGFELVGVCPAIPAPHHEFYRRWVQKGHHGTMSYLAEHLPLKEHPEALLPGVKSIVAVGFNYNQPNPVQPGMPRIARYALGRDYHKVIRGKLKTLACWIREQHPAAECRPCVDSAPIFERDYANLAGLGWFGKNTCLIDSRRGSWFFLGLLLTTVEFEPDEQAVGGCGTCTRCIEACPTGAIVFEEDRWQIDSRRCISYLTIEYDGEIDCDLAAGMGEWTFGCDVCQEVCPFNEPRESQPLRAIPATEKDFLTLREWPNLKKLSVISNDEWDGLTQGSPVRRAGAASLRRNATINLDQSP